MEFEEIVEFHARPKLCLAMQGTGKNNIRILVSAGQKLQDGSEVTPFWKIPAQKAEIP